MRRRDNDIMRASFQVGGRSYLYRHINEAGTTEYRCENYQGVMIACDIDPNTSFASFVERLVKVALDEALA